MIGYANHFTIGTDPEWEIHSRAAGINICAGVVGLTEGTAFGADQCGRMFECRAVPSRSAVDVTAGIFSCLKEFVVVAPGTLNEDWFSGGYGSDPLGGHVHFGRLRRALIDREIRALDHITGLLLKEGWADVALAQKRSKTGKFGKQGDVRKQKYGFEYRTPPSFISSPTQAFMWLAALKLAPLWPAEKPFPMALKALFEKFAWRDGDAALALKILDRTGAMGHYTRNNFLPNWGLPAQGPPVRWPRFQDFYIPPYLAPSRDDILEIERILVEGGVPRINLAQCPSRLVVLPEGIVPIPAIHGQVGMGEITAALCTGPGWEVHVKTNVDLEPKTLRILVSFPMRECKRMSRAAEEMTRKILKGTVVNYQTGNPAGHVTIYVSDWLRGKTGPAGIARVTRQLLSSGIAPLWEIPAQGPLPKWPIKSDRIVMAREPVILKEIL